MHRVARWLFVWCASVLGVAFGGLTLNVNGEDAHDFRVAASSPPQLVTLDLGPGFPLSRRGLHLTAGTAAASTVDEAIAQCVESDMEAVGAPGAAVTVMLDGAVIFDRGFGYKHRNRPDRVDSDTRFRIGSATKMFTAAAVLQQVEVGLVDLDAPVTDWIPELRLSGQWPAELITVRHLLTHSSALPDYYEDPLGPVGDEALGEWAGGLDGVQLHAPPGTFWNYSNPGFSLAGLVAERASGIPFRDLLYETGFRSRRDDARRHSTPPRSWPLATSHTGIPCLRRVMR